MSERYWQISWMGEGNFFFVGPGFFLQPGKITVSQKDVQGKDTFLLFAYHLPTRTHYRIVSAGCWFLNIYVTLFRPKVDLTQ